jgi:FKBP-type peptidyl-prolyl cis-trans isomerase FkpA
MEEWRMRARNIGTMRGTLMARTGVGLGVLLATHACISFTDGDAPREPSVYEVAFAARFNVNLSEMVERPSGLWYRDDLEGEGIEADYGHEIMLTYHGYLYDGTHFESSPEAEPFQFMLGAVGIMAGFQEAVLGMKAGGQRLALVPPSLAFGPEGSANGRVPPNTWMVFELHVLSIGGTF